MQNYKDELQQLTKILLKPEDQYDELFKVIDDLYKLFLTASGLETDTNQNREHIYLSNGKAIGPSWAAICVKEILRTKRFIAGFCKAIKSALAKFPERPIHIVYAGTGPFGTLAIPLTTIFTSEEINFTFMEINPESIQSLEKVIEAFGAEKYVNQIICCDACKYQFDKSKPIHMVITETMLNALNKEPQMAITMNLAPQMVEGGILIPQNIIIEAGLLDPKQNHERMLNLENYDDDYLYMLGRIFELNKSTPDIHPATAVEDGKKYSFSEVEVQIPKGIDSGYNRLCLFTTIQVFEDEQLTHWQCSLNMPYRIMTLDQEKTPVDMVGFRYMISEKPGFEWRLISCT